MFINVNNPLLTDHLLQFLIIPNTFSNMPSNKSNIYERHWSKLIKKILL